MAEEGDPQAERLQDARPNRDGEKESDSACHERPVDHGEGDAVKL